MCPGPATTRNRRLRPRPRPGLDLHADTGQIALEDAGLLEEFLTFARPEGQAKSRLDQHGTVLSAFTPGMDDVAAPEIDRGRLRAMLAEHVKPGTVRWGHKLVAATPLGDGTHRLEFANGTTAEVDLVIGADGAWSRVRCLISDAVPRYTGAVREFLLKEFDGWSAELLAFISDNDGDFANRPIYALPAPLTWAHTPGATLLGDAAHLVTP